MMTFEELEELYKEKSEKKTGPSFVEAIQPMFDDYSAHHLELHRELYRRPAISDNLTASIRNYVVDYFERSYRGYFRHRSYLDWDASDLARRLGYTFLNPTVEITNNSPNSYSLDIRVRVRLYWFTEVINIEVPIRASW